MLRKLTKTLVGAMAVLCVVSTLALGACPRNAKVYTFWG